MNGAYSYKGAAEYLGLSETAFRGLVSAGHVRAFRLPHIDKIIFPRWVLDQYIEGAIPYGKNKAGASQEAKPHRVHIRAGRQTGELSGEVDSAGFGPKMVHWKDL